MKEFLIFGGTLEGRKLSAWMSRQGWPHTVSVATEYGEEVMEPESGTTVRQGRMGEEEMRALLKSGAYLAVADATHPYAVEVSRNIRKACEEAGIPCIRLLRGQEEIDRESLEEEGRIYVKDAREAADWLEQRKGRIFLTTGSKELAVYAERISDRSRLFVRVLPTPEVLEACRNLGLEGRQICAMQGPFSREINEAMLRQSGASFLVTKDTGKTGGFPEKLQAAKALGIPAVILRRPLEEGVLWEEAKEKLSLLWEEAGSSGAFLPQKTEESKEKDTERTICCVGIGMGDFGSMTQKAREEILQAQILFGAERMLAAARNVWNREGKHAEMVCEYRGEKIREYLESHPGYTRIAVLFSGDVGFYSGARKFREYFPKDKVEFCCGISSVVYFASRIPTAWDDAKLFSIHGKKGNVVGQLLEHRKLFLLVSGAKEAEAVCRTLAEYDLKVRVTVGSSLGYPQEKILTGEPKDFFSCPTQGPHIMLLENLEAQTFRRMGLPDEAFSRGKVPMTKEEIRILSLARLRLKPDSVVYDVGAGTGSVSVEAALWCPQGEVYAIEKNPEGAALIRENARRQRAANVTVIEGTAPEAFENLPVPTHAFIGGSSGNLKEILQRLLERNPRIRIVINTVTLESLGETAQLLKEQKIQGEEIVQISAARGRKAGRYHLMNALNPVCIVSFGGEES